MYCYTDILPPQTMKIPQYMYCYTGIQSMDYLQTAMQILHNQMTLCKPFVQFHHPYADYQCYIGFFNHDCLYHGDWVVYGKEGFVSFGLCWVNILFLC